MTRPERDASTRVGRHGSSSQMHTVTVQHQDGRTGQVDTAVRYVDRQLKDTHTVVHALHQQQTQQQQQQQWQQQQHQQNQQQTQQQQTQQQQTQQQSTQQHSDSTWHTPYMHRAEAAAAAPCQQQIVRAVKPLFLKSDPAPAPPFRGHPSTPPGGWRPADISPMLAQQRQQQLRLRSRGWVADAKQDLLTMQPEPAWPAKYEGVADQLGVRQTETLDTSVVAGAVFSKATLERGVTLFEPFGGLCAGLEMCLRNGIRVQRYIYCDKGWTAQTVARHRVQQLAATYPDLFSPQAAEDMFCTVPQDITKIDAQVLVKAGAQDGSQWLVVAGWECQDLSSAGRCEGLSGPRSRTFFDIVRVVGALQQLQPAQPPAYILENAPMQYNHHPVGGERIRTVDFRLVCLTIGKPVTFDAARFGAYAARLRNYWTNLGNAALVMRVIEGVQREPGRQVNHILDPGRTCKLAKNRFTHPAFYPCNIMGQPMGALATLLAHQSTTFSDGRVMFKDILDERAPGQFFAANPDERERALGYATGATAAPGLTLADRHAVTGRCMDAHAMESLMAICMALERSSNQFVGSAMWRQPQAG